MANPVRKGFDTLWGTQPSNALTRKLKRSMYSEQTLGQDKKVVLEIDEPNSHGVLTIENYDPVVWNTGKMRADFSYLLSMVKTAKDQASIISLKDYCKARGLTDQQTARKDLVRNLTALADARFQLSQCEYKNGTSEIYQGALFTLKTKVRPIKGKDDTGKNIVTVAGYGEITIYWSKGFFEALSRGGFTLINTRLLQTPKHQPKLTEPLGCILQEHYKMNYGKANANTIRMKTIIDKLAEYGLINPATPHKYRDIICPIEGALDELGYIYEAETERQRQGIDLNTKLSGKAVIKRRSYLDANGIALPDDLQQYAKDYTGFQLLTLYFELTLSDEKTRKLLGKPKRKAKKVK